MTAMRPLSTDRLAMLPRGAAADAAQIALFNLQSLTPEEQVAGAALLFATFCHRCGLDPEQRHQIAMRMLREDEPHHTRTNNSLQSLRDFAGIVIKGDKDVSIA